MSKLSTRPRASLRMGPERRPLRGVGACRAGPLLRVVARGSRRGLLREDAVLGEVEAKEVVKGGDVGGLDGEPKRDVSEEDWSDGRGRGMRSEEVGAVSIGGAHSEVGVNVLVHAVGVLSVGPVLSQLVDQKRRSIANKSKQRRRLLDLLGAHTLRAPRDGIARSRSDELEIGQLGLAALPFLAVSLSCLIKKFADGTCEQHRVLALVDQAGVGLVCVQSRSRTPG